MRILIIEDEFNVIRLYKENKKIFLTGIQSFLGSMVFSIHF